MKPICSLLIFISLLQLMIPVKTEWTLKSLVEKNIHEALNTQGNIWGAKKVSCTSVASSAKMATCPAGMTVTGCACGFACGFWDVKNETTCHCLCPVRLYHCPLLSTGLR
ncbi:resistin-like beta [Nannospalax galili]|uniref:resistin-like beta n=1 Tax=Nannospalax galili TaxID=1026970 RepID=UPI00081A23D6|nr:resistin-like beta [Nannospalax galili]